MKYFVLIFILFIFVSTSSADTLTITASLIEDAGMNEFSLSGDANFGGSEFVQSVLSFGKPYIQMLDLSGITPPVTVTAVACSARTLFSTQANTWYLRRITTDWTEGVENNGLVTSGNPGVTWNNSIDYFGGEGTDVTWAVTDFSSSDYTPISTSIDTAVAGDQEWIIFDNANLISIIEDMINGVISIHSFAIWNEGGASDRNIACAERSTTSQRPRWFITFTAAGAAPQSQIISIN